MRGPQETGLHDGGLRAPGQLVCFIKALRRIAIDQIGDYETLTRPEESDHRRSYHLFP